jgi:hypothetical protein
VVVATAASTFSFQRKLQSDKIQQTSFKSSLSSFALSSFTLTSLPFLSVDGSRLNPWFGNGNRNLLAHFLVHLVALLIVLCVASGFAVNFADLFVCDLTRWDEATGFLPNDTALGYRDGSTLLLRNELALFLLFHFALTVACRVALLPVINCALILVDGLALLLPDVVVLDGARVSLWRRRMTETSSPSSGLETDGKGRGD